MTLLSLVVLPLFNKCYCFGIYLFPLAFYFDNIVYLNEVTNLYAYCALFEGVTFSKYDEKETLPVFDTFCNAPYAHGQGWTD